jgi:DNA-binding IclR family transcriptional regulator
LKVARRQETRSTRAKSLQMRRRTNVAQERLRRTSGGLRVETRKVTAAKGSPTPPQYPIESVDNALRLLSLFQNRDALRVNEASRLIGVAPSTAHRLLAMLQFHRFVARSSSRPDYHPGPALLDLGLSVVKALDLRSLARPHLEALAAQVPETVTLGVLQGRQIVFVDSVESHKSVRVGSRAGSTYPAHVTSAGKILLAQMPKEQFRELYSSARLQGGSARAVTSRRALERHLAEARRKGFALNLGESEDDLGAVSVAVLDQRHRARASLSLSMPLFRFSLDDVPRLVRLLAAAAARIGESIS